MKTVTIEVFDDPLYCSNSSGYCKHLGRMALNKYCSVFDKEIEYSIDTKVHKCLPCKDLFKSALSGEG